MRLLVDADACPNIQEIIELAEKYHVETFLFKDHTHDFTKYQTDAKVMTLDSSPQRVDIEIENEVVENDIVITQDYGVALLVLSKKARAINPISGTIYKEETMDTLLSIRYLHQKERQKGRFAKGPKKRTKEDENRFLTQLEMMMKGTVI